jgi:hypothetical protein
LEVEDDMRRVEKHPVEDTMSGTAERPADPTGEPARPDSGRLVGAAVEEGGDDGGVGGSTGAPIYVQAKIGGVPLQAIVDTGAGLSILREDVLHSMEIMGQRPIVREWKGGRPLGLGGGVLDVVAGVVLQVEVGSARAAVRFAVVRGHVPTLIGNDALKRLGGLTVDYDAQAILIQGTRVPFEKASPIFTVDTVEPVTLPPMTVALVECRVDGWKGQTEDRGNVLVSALEAAGSIAQAPSLMTARGITTAWKVSDGMHVWAHVTNPTGVAVVIGAGTQVGVAEPLGGPTVLPAFEEGEAGPIPERFEWEPTPTASEAPAGITDKELSDLLGRADPDLTEDQRRQLRELLCRNADLFCAKLTPGQSLALPHEIDTQGHRPIKRHPYRSSMKEKGVLEEEVRKMLDAGVVRQSNSPWSFPVVLVIKKDGSRRFCVDYRDLNKITKRDAYPLPLVDELLDQVGDSVYRSSMDLIAGYWQIALKEEDKEKTAFSVGNGLYEFNVVPFGLTNAPSSFQRNMEALLAGLTWVCCLVYMDDIIVYSRSFEEHLQHLQAVFDRLRQGRMFLKPSKCAFLRRELPFLGHLLTKEGLKPDPAKVAVIRDARPPRSIHEVRCFLGLANYYRRFIEGFADVAEPLHRLTGKHATFKWEEEQQAAFDELKKRLVTAPVIAQPRLDRPFVLHTDASAHAIGAVLTQVDEAGGERVIAYGSKALGAAERRYSPTHRECMAVVKWVKAFRHYLHGNRFTVVTDHNPLVWISGQRDPTNQLARWALTLQEFDFEIRYRPGRHHTNADAMTRGPINDGDSEELVAVVTRGTKNPENRTRYDRNQGVVGWEGHHKRLRPEQPTTRPTQATPAKPPAATENRALTPKGERSAARDRHRPTAPASPTPTNSPTEPTEPTATEPTATGPTEPTATEPTTTEPTATGPTEPTATEPTATGPTEPTATEPTTTEPTVPTPPVAAGTSTTRVVTEEDWIPISEQEEVEAEEVTEDPGELSAHNIRLAQRRDPHLKHIITYLEDQELPEEPRLAKRVAVEAGQMGVDEEGLLRHFWWTQRGDRRTDTRCQLVVPAELAEAVMRAMHDDILAGHLGEKRTLERIRVHYWWLGMFSQVKKWVRTCPTCQQRNHPKGRTPGLLQSIPPASRPFQRLGVDLIGPLPTSRKGNRHLLVFVDYLTKWPEVFALPEATADAVARVYVEQIICRHGAPEALLSDRGKQFLSEVLRHVNEYLRVRKVNTTAYHPQTDGLVERFNGTLENLLAKFANDHQDNWDDLLPYALLAYRTSTHEATHDSPFYLLYGREPYLPVDITTGVSGDTGPTTPETHRCELVNRLRQAHGYAHQNQLRAQASNQRSFDAGRDQSKYRAGDKVWLLAAHLPRGRTTKLAKMWRGPYRVSEVKGQLVIAVQPVNNPRDQQVVSVRRVKPCYLNENLSEFTQRLREQTERELAGDETEEVEIEAILDDRTVGRRQQYLVRFTGHTARYNAWVDEADIHADELLPRYLLDKKLAGNATDAPKPSRAPARKRKARTKRPK